MIVIKLTLIYVFVLKLKTIYFNGFLFYLFRKRSIKLGLTHELSHDTISHTIKNTLSIYLNLLFSAERKQRRLRLSNSKRGFGQHILHKSILA